MNYKITLKESIKQSIDIIKLDGKVIEKVSKDSNALIMGILIIVIGSIINQILNFNIIVLLITPIIVLVAYFLITLITHGLARLFGGTASYIEYFRAESHAAILSWSGILAIIPFLGNVIIFFISIWRLIVSVVILQNVHKLPRNKAIIVVLIPVILSILLVFIASFFYFGTSNPNALLPN